MAVILACAVDRAEHNTEIEANVVSQYEEKNTMAIKYDLLGVTFTENMDINSDSLFALVNSAVRDQKLTLSVKVKLATDNDGSDYSEIEYYFGPSLIYTNDDADGKLITHIAKSNPSRFRWEYRDGEEVEDEEEIVEEEPKEEKDKTTVKVAPFKKQRDL